MLNRFSILMALHRRKSVLMFGGGRHHALAATGRTLGIRDATRCDFAHRIAIVF